MRLHDSYSVSLVLFPLQSRRLSRVATRTQPPAGDGDRAIPSRVLPRRENRSPQSPASRAVPRRRRRCGGGARAAARGGVRPGDPAGLRGDAAERVVHRPGIPPARARPRLPPRVAGCWYAQFCMPDPSLRISF